MKSTFALAALTSTLSAIRLEATTTNNNDDVFVPTTDSNTFVLFSETGFETVIYTVHSEHKDWLDAQSTCQSEGGELVSIHNQAEAELVRKLADKSGSGTFLIGLNDRDNEGSFVWSDGTPVDYTNWWQNEPNNHGAGEDCAHMGFGD